VTTTLDLDLPERSYPPVDVTGMPAITLQNPWALAIVRYGKDVENRIWRPPTKLVGGRILIHAGSAWDESGLPALRRRGHEDALKHVVVSAIVAVADLEAVCSAAVDGSWCGCSAWAMPGQYHWRLGRVWPLDQPRECRGRQKLWYPDQTVVTDVSAILRAGQPRPVPLVCTGRRFDQDGRPAQGTAGDECGRAIEPYDSETLLEYHQRSRARGWRVGPDDRPERVRHVMCPGCASPEGTP
jgi:hypothetical protein